ncbi:MAG: sulfotransferase [Anaerolineaceae bacterium]|nr:sulfotransferase [Anaerolineaceae bacterium]
MSEYPHFFLVGAQRSGTTYLYHALSEHPDIEMASPIRPEPKYFLAPNSLALGVSHYEAAFFKGKAGAKIRGEKSTSYIESEAVAERIATAFPEARILISLRNPVERAISNYWFSVNNGKERLPMEEAFWKEEERREQYDKTQISASPYAYLKRGLYLDYIQAYERYFPPEQITVVIFKRLMTAPQVALPELYTALGVSPDFFPLSANRQINDSERTSEQPLSLALQAHLKAYFADANARLGEYLQVDLAAYGW